jgi:hypothetical protein
LKAGVRTGSESLSRLVATPAGRELIDHFAFSVRSLPTSGGLGRATSGNSNLLFLERVAVAHDRRIGCIGDLTKGGHCVEHFFAASVFPLLCFCRGTARADFT